MKVEFTKQTGEYNVGDVRTFSPSVAAIYLKQKRAKKTKKTVAPLNKAVASEDVKTKDAETKDLM